MKASISGDVRLFLVALYGLMFYNMATFKQEKSRPADHACPAASLIFEPGWSAGRHE